MGWTLEVVDEAVVLRAEPARLDDERGHRGLSNTEIDTLSMSPATAKTHVSRPLAMRHARDRARLVVRTYEAGVVAPGVP